MIKLGRSVILSILLCIVVQCKLYGGIDGIYYQSNLVYTPPMSRIPKNRTEILAVTAETAPEIYPASLQVQNLEVMPSPGFNSFTIQSISRTNFSPLGSFKNDFLSK
jgi:hypothetical protein